MWRVFEAKTAAKHIDQLPRQVLEKYELWKSVAEISGPEGIRAFRGFRDHALKGKWAGYRSSYLNDSYRVIYRFEGDEVRVYVMDETHHDYRRKS